MSKESKPPGERTGNDDFDPWSYAEVFHRTVRYGAGEARRYYDALELAGIDEDCERLRKLGADLGRSPTQAEVIPFPRKEPGDHEPER